jgi:hypothetical protein
MTDELDALEKRARETTEQMANQCSVGMQLWDKHSNACLELADSHASLRRQLAEKEVEAEAALETLEDEKAAHADTLRLLTAERRRAEKAERHLELSRQNIVGIERDRDEFWNKFQAEVTRGKTAREERDAALASIAEKEARITELTQELVTERHSAEVSDQTCTAEMAARKVAEAERDAALAEARELREWADAMNTALDAFWNDPERPSLHRMRSETTSKICVLQEKHRTRIDAKLTDGETAMSDTFYEYLERAEKDGIIDFSLRIVRNPQGCLHFYIHPYGKDGETGDFSVNGGFVCKLDCAAGSSLPTIRLVGSSDAKLTEGA